MTIVYAATRTYKKCGGTYFVTQGRITGEVVGILVLGNPGKWRQRVDETTPEHR